MERGWKRTEIAQRKVDVHARWKPEREAGEKRIEGENRTKRKKKKKTKTKRRRQSRRSEACTANEYWSINMVLCASWDEYLSM